MTLRYPSSPTYSVFILFLSLTSSVSHSLAASIRPLAVFVFVFSFLVFTFFILLPHTLTLFCHHHRELPLCTFIRSMCWQFEGDRAHGASSMKGGNKAGLIVEQIVVRAKAFFIFLQTGNTGNVTQSSVWAWLLSQGPDTVTYQLPLVIVRPEFVYRSTFLVAPSDGLGRVCVLSFVVIPLRRRAERLRPSRLLQAAGCCGKPPPGESIHPGVDAPLWSICL